MVDRELARFVERQVSPAAEPVVRHLGARAEQMRREELSKVVKRLPDLSTEQIEAMDAMTRALVRACWPTRSRSCEQRTTRDAAEAVLQIFSLYPDEESGLTTVPNAAASLRFRLGNQPMDTTRSSSLYAVLLA